MSIKCLILSHAFNMDGRAASQTITDKVAALRESGLELFVLSAITGERDKHLKHRRIIGIGPSALRFDLRHLLARHIGRGYAYTLIMAFTSLSLAPFILIEKVIVGLSSHWSWTIISSIQGLIWMKKYDIDLIYSTGGAWSAHLSGWILKLITKAPWIVEFHDPMVELSTSSTTLTNYRERVVKKLIERLACNEATLIWWFTEAALEQAARRYRAQRDKLFCTLPGAMPPKERVKYQRGDRVRFAHFGSLSATRSLSHFVTGLSELFKSNPQLMSLIEVHIYGSKIDNLANQLILDNNISACFVEHGRIEKSEETLASGREKILTLMQQSDCLILLHGCDENCELYIPSKLYEYWWASRPIFALVHQNPQLESIVKAIHPENFLIATLAPVLTYRESLERFIKMWQNGEFDNFCPALLPASPGAAVELIVEKLREKTILFEK